MGPSVVTAAVFMKGQAVLLMRRAPGQKLAGKWEFPGGKMEDGETPQSCLRRELKEELDVVVEVGRHVCDSLYTYPSGSILLKAFFVELRTGDIHLHVHDEMQWVNYMDLLSFELAPADIEIVKKVQEVMGYV